MPNVETLKACGFIIVFLALSFTLILVYRSDRFEPTRFRQYPRIMVNQNTKYTCTPKKNIFFMKTHKTASTTVQNILLRYADKNDLFVGLQKVPMFGYLQGKTFQKDFILPSTRDINMICHHLRLNVSEIRASMPNDTVFITILREPGSQFESIFDYFHNYCKYFSDEPQNRTGFINWLENPQKHIDKHPKSSIPWMAQNSVFYDLGYNNTNNNLEYIDQSIEEISNIFNLVLISDFFDLSVLLLKELLCWELQDVLYLVSNARSKTTTQIDDDLRSKITDWNLADSRLYNHFSAVFLKKIAAYGNERLNRDLKTLKQLNSEMRENCLKGGRTSNQEIERFENQLHNPEGVVMTGYNLKNESEHNTTCKAIIRPENSWIDYLLYKEYKIHSTRSKRDLKNCFYY